MIFIVCQSPWNLTELWRIHTEMQKSHLGRWRRMCVCVRVCVSEHMRARGSCQISSSTTPQLSTCATGTHTCEETECLFLSLLTLLIYNRFFHWTWGCGHKPQPFLLSSPAVQVLQVCAQQCPVFYTGAEIRTPVFMLVNHIMRHFLRPLWLLETESPIKPNAHWLGQPDFP